MDAGHADCVSRDTASFLCVSGHGVSKMMLQQVYLTVCSHYGVFFNWLYLLIQHSNVLS